MTESICYFYWCLSIWKNQHQRSIQYWHIPDSILGITAWKVYVFWVFLVRIFPRSDWIRRDTPYLSEFSLNAEKYRPEKHQIRTLFTHWITFGIPIQAWTRPYEWIESNKCIYVCLTTCQKSKHTFFLFLRYNSANIYLFKVNNRNTRNR